MGEIQKDSEFLKKLAIISEAASETVEGKFSVVFEVNRFEFAKILSSIGGKSEEDKNQFKIEISDNDFIFILDE
jgi:hypothetical protein